MWSTIPCRSLAKRLLPATILLALAGHPAALFAQQSGADKVAIPSSRSAANQEIKLSQEGIGDARLAEHRYQEAIEAYQKSPNRSADVWDKMGIAYQLLFDMKDAARCYRQSLRLDPQNAHALNNLATVYDSMNNHRKAEQLYRKAMKLDPNSAVVALDLGTNLMVQNKYDRGLEMYQRALKIDPKVLEERDHPVMLNPMTAEQSGAVNYYKAKGFAQIGMTENAIRYLRRALNEGFTTPERIAADSSFSQLETNPAFQKLMAERAGQKSPRPNGD